MSREGIAKHVTEVVPDVGAVKVVGEVGLGGAGPETILGDSHLESAAAGYGVTGEPLAVGAALGGKAPWASDLGTDRPDRDGEIALVDDVGGTDCGDGGERGEGDSREGDERAHVVGLGGVSLARLME